MSGNMITDDTAGSFVTGRRTVGATAAQISSAERKLTRGVEIKTAAANTGTVYVGNAASVTGDAADGTDGFPLAAGERKFFIVDDLPKLWVIGSAASQKFWFHAV